MKAVVLVFPNSQENCDVMFTLIVLDTINKTKLRMQSLIRTTNLIIFFLVFSMQNTWTFKAQ